MLMFLSGSTDWHCNAGCQSGYGICNDSPSVTTSALPSPTQRVSTNARCGSDYGASPGGMTCLGAIEYGECCSQLGFCGRSGLHCGAGCQAGFGKCEFILLPPSPSSSSQSLKTSITSPAAWTITLIGTTRTSEKPSLSSFQSSSYDAISSIPTTTSIAAASSIGTDSFSLSASSSTSSNPSTNIKLPMKTGVSSSDNLPPASLSSLSGGTYCRSSCKLSIILCVVSWVFSHACAGRLARFLGVFELDQAN